MTNLYEEWQKLCDEHDAARDACSDAFKVVNSKFAAVVKGTSRTNPTEEETRKIGVRVEGMGRRKTPDAGLCKEEYRWLRLSAHPLGMHGDGAPPGASAIRCDYRELIDQETICAHVNIPIFHTHIHHASHVLFLTNVANQVSAHCVMKILSIYVALGIR